MKLIYYPNEFLDKKVKDVNIESPEFDPKESKQLFNREINHLKYLIDTVDDYFRQT